MAESVAQQAARHMIIAVSGSRSIVDRARIYEILDSETISYLTRGWTVEFRLGDAAGVDEIARQWCRDRSMRRTIFFADRKKWDSWARGAQLRDFADPGAESGLLAADWAAEAKYAGPIRNHTMLVGCREDYDGAKLAYPIGKSDLLVAIWDGSSPGTRNAMVTARNSGVFIHQWGGDGAIAFVDMTIRGSADVEFKGKLISGAGA